MVSYPDNFAGYWPHALDERPFGYWPHALDERSFGYWPHALDERPFGYWPHALDEWPLGYWPHTLNESLLATGHGHSHRISGFIFHISCLLASGHMF